MAEDFFGGIGDALGTATNAIGEVAGGILGATVSAVGGAINGFGTGFSSFASSPGFSNGGSMTNSFASFLRSASIPPGAEANYDYNPVSAQFSASPEEKDWRVKISCDRIINNSPVMIPLQQTGGMIFPFTPTITMSHTANYTPIETAHTNYPFYAYKNSQIDDITITGKFAVQDELDAAYWLGSMHFLRTVTKMYFGQGNNLGNPPPICVLNGYGDFVYNNVSVVVKNFSITLPDNVDYIAANLGTTPGGESGENLSYVPVLSDITVQLVPVYSREKIKTFNLEAFAAGQLISPGDNRGFI